MPHYRVLASPVGTVPTTSTLITPPAAGPLASKAGAAPIWAKVKSTPTTGPRSSHLSLRRSPHQCQGWRDVATKVFHGWRRQQESDADRSTMKVSSTSLRRGPPLSGAVPPSAWRSQASVAALGRGGASHTTSVAHDAGHRNDMIGARSRFTHGVSPPVGPDALPGLMALLG